MNKPIYVGLAKAQTSRLIVSVILLVVVAGRAFNANAQTVTILHSFVGSPNDGYRPYDVGLVQGSDGSFYGTTINGGTNSSCGGGCGTVFRISPSGTETTLYSFVGSPNDGYYPRAGLVQGSDGNFYGTTAYGGTSGNCGGGCGTVFRISPSGIYTNLHSFAGSSSEGAQPAGLVQGSDGNFYGTTGYGGTNNVGTVFQISPNGTYKTLYSFSPIPTSGVLPFGGLVQGSDGNLYGTTEGGGMAGTVFRISASGSYTNLHSFVGSPHDGDSPYAGLTRGRDGNFYGTTASGGSYTSSVPPYDGYGTIFRISPSGTYTSLYSFGGPGTVGVSPFAALVQGSDGNFYGTTEGGNGTLFRVSTSGTCTSLYSFGSVPDDGNAPNAGLVQGSDGSFYGTTPYGGTNSAGTVFKLIVPLNPPANQISGVQMAGNDVTVSIPSVAYETYQLQFSSSLTAANWVNVPGASVTNCIGALLTLTNFGGAVGPQMFYRFDITP